MLRGPRYAVQTQLVAGTWGGALGAALFFRSGRERRELRRRLQSKQVSPLPEEAAMLVLMRSFAVIVGILALVAASLYATLVVWERTHPPRLPTVSTAAPQPAVLYRSMPARGAARPMR